ncbi:pectin lyase-like protein [Clavulina sp. PMI_390]|nr:pectin lyase-like protein [Clavulina sp. PMI_390]
MKFSTLSIFALVAPFTFATPLAPVDVETVHVAKRATVTDTATTGYASGALTSAVSGDSAAIVVISGTITGNTVVKIGSNKTVVGKAGASFSANSAWMPALVGVGLRVLNVNNVIIRNIKISKVLASAGDAIGVQASYKVWIDHNELSSDMSHDKDYYDGLLDITHGCYAVTYSYNILHDHWKTSLIGHSDSNGSEDVALRVTVHHNYWYNLNSRLPSFRFGQGHIYNNYYLNSGDGINTRDGALLLIQNNVFKNVSDAIYSTDGGYATVSGNDLGGSTNTAPAGTAPSIPYSYTLDSISGLPAAVVAAAGANLGF